MSKLIAIGGGLHAGDFDIVLEEKVRSFLPEQKPSVVFVPYGEEDFSHNYEDFKSIYEELGCEVKLLQPGLEALLEQADLIYLGRGSTLELVKRLQETNAAQRLLAAHQRGAILAGFSAGAHSLFSQAGSYEDGQGLILADGLGFVSGCIICHYNYADRAEAFHGLLKENNLDGIGVDDHAMLIIESDKMGVFSSKEEANGYFIMNDGTHVTVKEISGQEKIVTIF